VVPEVLVVLFASVWRRGVVTLLSPDWLRVAVLPEVELLRVGVVRVGVVVVPVVEVPREGVWRVSWLPLVVEVPREGAVLVWELVLPLPEVLRDGV